MSRVFFLAVLLLLPSAALSQVTRAAHKHCICVSVGPKGGCLRWSCRRQYERPRP